MQVQTNMLIQPQGFEPTVLSSDRTEQIAELRNRLQKMASDKAFIGPDGLGRYADGSLIPQPMPPQEQQGYGTNY